MVEKIRAHVHKDLEVGYLRSPEVYKGRIHALCFRDVYSLKILFGWNWLYITKIYHKF